MRLIYFCFESEQQIWLMTVCGKDEADDLSPAEKRQLKMAISAELKTRSVERVGKMEGGKEK